MRSRTLAAAMIAAVPVAVAACGTDADEPDAADGGPPPGEVPPLAQEPPPVLDAEAGSAETPAGVIDSQRAEGTAYVGTVTDDLYIAVALDRGTGAGGPQDALVYVCDGHGGGYITGEVGSGMTTLTGDGMNVTLTRAGRGVTGTVALGDRPPLPFTARRATGVAGLHGGRFDADGVDYRPVWVVLPDGSQRGGACWQCCSGEGCSICCPAPADTAGPTVDPEPETWWQRWFRN